MRGRHEPAHSQSKTGTGLIWNDLEDVCLGPVHWDVAGLVSDARSYGASEAFITAFVDAYGGVELDELDDFVAAHELYSIVWRAFATQPRGADGKAA